MSFTALLSELKVELEKNKEEITKMRQTNPRRLFTEINEIAYSTSAKHGFVLQLHFPNPKKLADTDSYGNENLGIVVDPKRKEFPISRDSIKEKAEEIFGRVETKDAFMSEGKEGVQVFLHNGRIDILPGVIHMWCQIDDNVQKFVDWLLIYCYAKPT